MNSNNILVELVLDFLKIKPLRALGLYFFGLGGYLALSELKFSYSDAALIFILIMSARGVYSFTKILFPINGLFSPRPKNFIGHSKRSLVLIYLIVFSLVFVATAQYIFDLFFLHFVLLLLILIAAGIFGNFGLAGPYLKSFLAGLAPVVGYLVAGGNFTGEIYPLWLATALWWAGLEMVAIKIKNSLPTDNFVMKNSSRERLLNILIILNLTIAILGWLAFGRLTNSSILYFSLIICFFGGSIFIIVNSFEEKNPENSPTKEALALMSTGFFLGTLLEFLIKT
ncbi:MAG: hypothetical protein ACQEP7_02045 [bacterium]